MCIMWCLGTVDQLSPSVLTVAEFIRMDAGVTQGKKCVRYIWRSEGVWHER